MEALSKAEKAHRQLDEEARILANRIKLLEIEEKRIWRRISETKQKTLQFTKNKAALEAKHQAKLELQERRRNETDQLHISIMRSRELRKTEQSQAIKSLTSYKRKEADLVRATKERLKKKANEQLDSQRLYSSHQARLIRLNSIRAHKSVEKRRFKQRTQLDHSFAARDAEASSKQIVELERDEEELISRLKFVYAVQEHAYGDLANVLKKAY